MSCRTTQAGSAFTTYARLANGGVLSDVATLSTFHYLRNLYAGRDAAARRAYSDADYRALLERQRDRVARNTNLTESRRASILARLDAAAAGPVPDQATLYALFNLNPTVRDRGNALARQIRALSEQLGLSYDDTLARFRSLENAIDRSRGAADPATYTQANIDEVSALGLGTEAGTVHAVISLREQGRRRLADQALTQPQRVARTAVERPQEAYGFSVVEHGFDARNGRLEVVVRNEATGETETLAYRGYSQESYNAHFAQTDGHYQSVAWFNSIRSNSALAYADTIERDLDSVAPRCAVCGQFANNLHSCPQIGEPRRMRHHTTSSRWSRQQAPVQTVDRDGNPVTQTGAFTLPAIREFREAFSQGPVNIAVDNYMAGYQTGGRWGYAYQRGELTVYRDGDGNMAFNTANARCTCPQFTETQTCPHIDAYVTAVRTRLTPAPRTAARRLTPEERAEQLAQAQAIAEQAARTDWTRTEEGLAEARRTWRSNAEVTYSENFEEFAAVYNAAVAARAGNEGTPVIPYLRDNVLDGMAARGSGQAFGMEIEYEFPAGVDRAAAQRAIGAELFAAGLAGSTQQQGYGTSKRRGFRDTHIDPSDGKSNWSWEFDGSVNGGELVTPAMYDEPETWEKLEKAVEILRRNGAVPTKRAGAHVHVGTAMYQGDPGKYAELARMMTQHEDVMLRLAAEPKRGTHRNSGYTSPLNEVPPAGFADVGSAVRWQGGRTRVLNMYGVNQQVDSAANAAERAERSRGDHPEFRIFDSTLDAGAMQTQIKLAVAMTHAAARNADAGGTSRGKEVAGSHAQRLTAIRGNSRRALTDDELRDDTATFRSLLDTLFTRKVDKDQVTALFANTKWSPRR